MTSELVSNVVEHAKTPVTVRVEVRAATVRVAVRDGQAATAAFREIVAAPPKPVAASVLDGRGLQIVKTLASAVGLADCTDGKEIWFEMSRTPA